MATRKRPARPGKRLTPKQLAFIEALCADPSQNGTRAAIKAGYSEDSASSQAYELLHLPQYGHVQAEVAERNKVRLAALGVSEEKTWRALAAIAYGNIAEVISWAKDGTITLKPSEELWPEQLAIIKEVKLAEFDYGKSLSVKFKDSLTALQTLAKMQGLLKDRVELEAHVSIAAARESLKSALARLAVTGSPGPVDQQLDGQGAPGTPV